MSKDGNDYKSIGNLHVPHLQVPHLQYATGQIKKHMKHKIMVPVTSLIGDTVQLLEAEKGEVVWENEKKCLLRE